MHPGIKNIHLNQLGLLHRPFLNISDVSIPKIIIIDVFQLVDVGLYVHIIAHSCVQHDGVVSIRIRRDVSSASIGEIHIDNP